jgi:hypothetical protein
MSASEPPINRQNDCPGARRRRKLTTLSVRFRAAPIGRPAAEMGRKQKFKLRHHQNPMCGAKAIDDAMPELDSLMIGDAVSLPSG